MDPSGSKATFFTDFRFSNRTASATTLRKSEDLNFPASRPGEHHSIGGGARGVMDQCELMRFPGDFPAFAQFARAEASFLFALKDYDDQGISRRLCGCLRFQCRLHVFRLSLTPAPARKFRRTFQIWNQAV